MRVLRAAGLGVAVLVSQATAYGQSPAARFGRIRAIEIEPTASAVQPAALLIPSQPPPAAAQPVFGQPAGFPSWTVVANQAPAGGGMPPTGGAFQNPAQPSTGPSVTELRQGQGGPAASFNVPHAGGPVTWAPPVPGQSDCPTCGPQGLLSGPPAVCPTDPCLAPNMDSPLVGGALRNPLGLLTTPNRFQTDAEVLLWFVQPLQVPTLLTTSTTAGSAGILGRPDTRVLFGNSNVGNSFQVGGRFGGVYWFGQRQVWGLDGDVWFLPRNGQTFTYTSAVDPVLARPFFNVNQGTQFSQLVAAPGLATGTASILTETSLWGAQANARRYIGSTCRSRLDAIAGFRFMHLSDELRITETFSRTPGSNFAIGNPDVLSGTVVDRFRTENDFYGAQVGLVGETRRGRWFAEGRASIALGTVHQMLQAEGSQNLTLVGGGTSTATGGLLALPGANIGTFRQDKFGVVPEATLRLGFYVTPHLRVSAGYNFLYLSSVLRPGDQIDPGLDVNKIPNFPLPGNPQTAFGRPSNILRDTGLTAQGISFSLQYQW